jgi:hypothetical protein
MADGRQTRPRTARLGSSHNILLGPAHFTPSYKIGLAFIFLNVIDTAMSTFHRFPLLPTELRLQIWEATIEPRTVMVCFSYKPKTNDYLLYPRLQTCTPVPAPLQTSQEARSHLKGFYQQLYSEQPVELEFPIERFDQTIESPRRYVWFIPAIDIVDIGGNQLERLRQTAPLVQRLEVERLERDTYWLWLEAETEFPHYHSLKEMRVVTKCDFSAYVKEDSLGRRWPCAKEGVILIDANGKLKPTTLMALVNGKIPDERVGEPAFSIGHRHMHDS